MNPIRRIACAMAACCAFAGPLSAQKVEVRSASPSRVELPASGGDAVVTLVGAGVETLTSGYVESARRPVRGIRVRVLPGRRGEARVSIVAEAGVAALRGVLVLSNREGRVRIPGLDIVVVAQARVTAPPVFDPVTFTTPALQARGLLAFVPVEFTSRTLSIRGTAFAPIQFTTSVLSVRGTTFHPVEFTTRTLSVRANGGGAP